MSRKAFMHIYEVRRAKIIAESISFPMCCHSDDRGMGSLRERNRPMPSTAAAHMMPWIRVYDAAGNVAKTYMHAGESKKW